MVSSTFSLLQSVDSDSELILQILQSTYVETSLGQQTIEEDTVRVNFLELVVQLTPHMCIQFHAQRKMLIKVLYSMQRGDPRPFLQRATLLLFHDTGSGLSGGRC